MRRSLSPDEWQPLGSRALPKSGQDRPALKLAPTAQGTTAYGAPAGVSDRAEPRTLDDFRLVERSWVG